MSSVPDTSVMCTLHVVRFVRDTPSQPIAASATDATDAHDGDSDAHLRSRHPAVGDGTAVEPGVDGGGGDGGGGASLGGAEGGNGDGRASRRFSFGSMGLPASSPTTPSASLAPVANFEEEGLPEQLLASVSNQLVMTPHTTLQVCTSKMVASS